MTNKQIWKIRNRNRPQTNRGLADRRSEGHDANRTEKVPVTNLEDMGIQAITLKALVDSKDQELE